MSDDVVGIMKLPIPAPDGCEATVTIKVDEVRGFEGFSEKGQDLCEIEFKSGKYCIVKGTVDEVLAKFEEAKKRRRVRP